MTFETCVPRLLWTPEHFRHMNTPILADLQVQRKLSCKQSSSQQIKDVSIGLTNNYAEHWVMQNYPQKSDNQANSNIQIYVPVLLHMKPWHVRKQQQFEVEITYAHLGSGALQSAHMRLSLLCSNSLSFLIPSELGKENMSLWLWISTVQCGTSPQWIWTNCQNK